MRIWMIATTPSNKDRVLWGDENPYDQRPGFDGTNVIAEDVPRSLAKKRRLKRDLYSLDPSVLLISNRAHAALAQILERSAQCFEVSIGDQNAWLVNVTTVADCLSEESDVLRDRYKEFSWIKLVREYSIRYSAIKDAVLFKIKGLELRGCYCTDEFVREVIKSDLEGFRFVPVWDSALPSGTMRFEGLFDWGIFYVDSGKKGHACLPGDNPESFGRVLSTPCDEAQSAKTSREYNASKDGRKSETYDACLYDGPPLDADILAARAAALASLPDLPASGGALADGPCAPLGSRVGGEPAMLPGEEWPLGPGGEPLCFLAQLDMADLSALPGFPRQGLLRLFVGPEPEYGVDPNDMAAQMGFRALFAPDPSGAVLRPAPDEGAEDGLGWGEGPWAVRFGAPAPTPPDDYDFRVQGAFSREWAAAHPDLPAGGTEDADLYASDPSLTLGLAIAAHRAAGGPPTVQVGGYPRFVQVSDPRGWEERYDRYDALLLQLSSDHGRYIEIGDGGRMYFFAPSGKLAAGDFSDIMYWWDCM